MAVLGGKLFGTNGVRFVPGVDADLDFVIELGESLGTYFSDGEILVGRDGRLSGTALAAAVMSGLMSSGRSVADAGMVPTPALQYSVGQLGYRGGVMVTASHNPSEYNGFKVVGSDGVEIPRLDEQKIEKIFKDGSQTKANWKEVGTARDEPSVIKTYLRGVLSKINRKQIAERKFTVVVDPGNGAQCLAAPFMLDSLDCKVVTINGVVDGKFPGRGPEPTPDTLHDLSAAVKAVGADIGVGYDGDGDRAIFCDEEGKIYWGDQTGSLLVDYLCERRPGAIIVTPVSSSQAVEIVAKRRGASVVRTRVGSVDVSRTILERKAFFGFEENGGCIYPAHVAVRDGAMTTALVLECLAARGTSFSRTIANTVPRFFQAKTKIQVIPEKIKQVLGSVSKQAGGRIERVDGLKVWIDEHSWVLVRPSGTEPLIRIFVESDAKEKAELLLKKYSKLVRAA